MRLSFLPIAIALSACGGSVSQVAEPIAVTAAARTPLAGAPIGESALLTVALRPNRWDALRQAAFAEAAGDLPVPEDDTGTLDDLLREVTSATRDGAPTPYRSLAGVDPERPVFFRFGEASESLVDVLNVADGTARSDLRHVVAIPARDSSALQPALQTYVSACEALPSHAYLCPGAGRMDFVAADAWVFAVLRPDGRREDPAPELPSLLTPASGGAVAWALQSESPIGALLRSTRVRGPFMHDAAVSVRRALEAADETSREDLLMAAAAEIGGVFLLASAHSREYEALAARATIEPLSISFAGAMSARGERQWFPPADAARQATALGFSAGSTSEELRSSMDLRAVLPFALVPFGYGQLQRSGTQYHRAVRECGAPCFVQSAFQIAGTLAHGVRATIPFTYDPTLAPGRVEYSTLFFAKRLHIVGTIGRERWTGGFSMSREGALQAMANAESFAPTMHSEQVDGAALACLEQAGDGVMRALDEHRRADDPRAFLAAARAAFEALECPAAVASEVQQFERALAWAESRLD